MPSTEAVFDYIQSCCYNVKNSPTMEQLNTSNYTHRVITFWLLAVLLVCAPTIGYLLIDIIGTILKVLSDPKSLAGLTFFVIIYFALSFASGDIYIQKGKLEIKESDADTDNIQHMA